MSNLITRIASAITALAMIVMLMPVSAFAQTLGDITDTDTPVVETPSTTDEAPAADPALAPLSSAAALAPLATNDGGQFDGFNNGTVDGQDGWVSNGSVDQAIVDNTTGPASFGLKALRMSNAVSTGGFGDQVFSTPLADSVGESSATAAGFTVGTRHNHFEMAFDFISAIPNFEQPGLAVTISPDRGDGSRMSFLRLEDSATGVNVFFDDVQGTGSTPDFEETQIATNLDRTAPHNVKLTLDTIDGPSNDVVNVYIDGALVHTGTSWENYYRYATEASAEQSPRIVKTVLFRMKTSAPATAGNGFLFDHVTTTTGTAAVTPAPTTTTVVRAADLDAAPTASSTKWFAYDESTNSVNNNLVSFVAGPDTAPLGTGSAQLTVASTSHSVLLSTLSKGGTRLADITELQYSSYRSAGDPALAPTLQFDFDNDPNTVNPYLGRLVYEPYFTQTVASSTWQTWDALNDSAGTGTGNWWFSGATSPSKLAFAPNLANCTQSNPCTWAEVKAAFPMGAVSANGNFGLRAGGWSSDFTGNVDKLVFGTYASGTETVDFDNDAAVVPPVTGGNGGGSTRGFSGGGGGGGFSSGTPSGTATGTTTTTGGQVLGASIFNFTRDLHIGLRGTDVTELQTELIAAGYSIPAGATGYFGVQTRAAVAAWQAKFAVMPSVGYFGKISRAKYVANGGFGSGLPVTPPVTTTTTTTTSTGTTSTTTISH